MRTHEITLQDLYEMVEELRKDMSDQNQATQRAIAVIRGEVTNLYSLWQSHKCWIE